MTLETTPRMAGTPRIGVAGFALGALALLVVCVTFVAGPFAPQHSVGVSLGEIAAEAGKATLRNWLGQEQPPPQAATWTIDRILWVSGVVLGVLALLSGALALILHERRDVAFWAIGLGLSAVLAQILASTLMIILGFMVLCALIYALGDMLSL